MSFMTYYETGSISAGTKRFHKKTFASKKKAVEHARKLSKFKNRGYVTVNKGGREVAECYKGVCLKR
jgi:hypothetical protein